MTKQNNLSFVIARCKSVQFLYFMKSDNDFRQSISDDPLPEAQNEVDLDLIRGHEYIFQNLRNVMRYSIFLILIVLCQLAFGQEYRQARFIERGSDTKIPIINPILFRTYPVAIDSNQFRLYFITELMHDYMQFTLEGTEYKASSQLEVDLIHSKTKAVYSKIWRPALVLQNFGETNRRDKFSFSIDSLDVPEGIYQLNLNYHDLQGNQKKLYKMNLVLSGSADFYASPPLLCTAEDNNPQLKGEFPGQPVAFRQELQFNKEYSIYLKAWAPADTSVTFKTKILRDADKKVLFQKDTVVAVRDSHASLLLTPPFLQWDEGKYVLNVEYVRGKKSAKQIMPLQLIWFSKPYSLWARRTSEQPLAIILAPDVYDNLTSGDKQEQQKKFDEYWKDKDPTPATAYNEVMAEFYTRVDSVNEVWGKKGRNGWRTDPGRIYILYGKPDAITDRSLDPANPYMKWTYRLPDRKLVFTFAALEGRKKYKLIDEAEEPVQ